MALAQSDRESLGFKPESTYGTISSTGNYYQLRMNGEQLKYDLTTAKSQEIVNDRTVRDLITVDAAASGPLPTEFSYGEYDSLICAALCTTPANVVGTNGAGTGTATFSATGMTFSSGTIFSNVASGQWIRISGATNTGNNKLVQTTATGSATGITVASGTFTAETGTTGVVAYGRRFLNGTSKISHSIERYNADIAMYEAFRGMVVDKWRLDLKPGSILGQQFEFVGKDSNAMSTGSSLPGTGVTSLTNRILNSVDNISNITEGGASLTGTYAKNLNFAVNNNVEGLDALGTLGNIDFRLGEFNCTLKTDLYLADATYYNKFRNGTATSFSFRLTDASSNAYVITLPNMRYSTAERPNPGRNQALMLSITGEALKDTTTGYAVIVDACGAAVTPWA